MAAERVRHDGPMDPAADPPPRISAAHRVAGWCQREPVAAVTALVVAGFLLLTPATLAPVHVSAYEIYLPTPSGGTLWAIRALMIAAGVCVVAGILLARRHVVLATCLTLLPLLSLPWWHIFAWGWFLATIAVAVVAATVSWRRAIVPYVAALAIATFYSVTDVPAALPIGPVTSGTSDGPHLVVLALYVVAITAVVAMSASISASGRAQQLNRAARTQEQHAKRIERVVSERAQVARDLHDVVAHHVSLIAVRAESAPYQHPDLGDDARTVLAQIAEDARQALGELRQVLVVLQRAEASADDQPSRAPQPDASDVHDLVRSARDAGQQVDVDGRWEDVPPAPGYVLYRAVQEGLTNARRHAPQSVVTLTLTQTASTIGFTMTNSTDDSDGDDVEAGRGTVGMRERVESLGGAMSTSIVGGQFELTITVPAATGAEVVSTQVGA